MLFIILGCIPFFGSFGGKLVIFNFGIIDRIEEVFEIIEYHFVWFLTKTNGNQQYKEYGAK